MLKVHREIHQIKQRLSSAVIVKGKGIWLNDTAFTPVIVQSEFLVLQLAKRREVKKRSYEMRAIVQNTNTSAQLNSMILSMFEQMSNHATNWDKANNESKIVNESLTAELERYKEQVKILEQRFNVDLSGHEKFIDSQMDDMIRMKNTKFAAFETEIDTLKQALSKHVKEKESLLTTLNGFKMELKETMHMLTKPQVFYDNTHKQALGYKNPFYLKRAQRIKPILYDGNVLSKTHDVLSVVYDEETLILAEESRLKMVEKQNDPIMKKEKINITLINYSELKKLAEDFGKRFVPQQELSAEQKFWLQSSDKNSEEPSTSNTPAKIKVSNELPKLQANDTVISKLKETTHSLRENVNPAKVKKDIDEIETTNIELEHTQDMMILLLLILNSKSMENADLKTQIQEKVFANATFKNELRKLKGKNVIHLAVSKPYATTIALGMFKLNLEPLALKVLKNKDAHLEYIKHSRELADILREIVESARAIALRYRRPKATKSVGSSSKSKIIESSISNQLEPTQTRESTIFNVPSSSFIDCSTVKFGNDQIAKIMGYDDYQIGNVTISRVYYVEGLRHNLFSIGQFCDSDLEVAFRKHTCFVRNLEGVDLLTGSRGTNLYTLSIGDMMKSSPICLLSKASKTKSWLWHRRLSHLNFGTINQLAKQGLVRGLPKLKFEKDHLCSACSLGKSKKQSHKPKSEDTNQEKLYLLHMDLCGPMRVESINGKKYILVIVDDYSRFTWVKFLRSKDEAPEFIIKFLKMIQVCLNATVRNIRIDNVTAAQCVSLETRGIPLSELGQSKAFGDVILASLELGTKYLEPRQLSEGK
ncbi:retrovirus-related pol polyprotein from transposon TNT 1-94 [Tanacetum coccineum]